MEKIIKHIPIFAEGVILRAEKLQALADQTLMLPNLMRQGFTDGVVAGCDVSVLDRTIIMSKGVVSFENQIFLIDEPVALAYFPSDKTTYFKLCYLDKTIVRNGATHTFSLELSNEKAAKNELELCRFKLQEGANLRYEYDDFEDLNTEFDTINIIRTEYSSKDSTTINIKILKLFAREMLALKPTDMLDTFFCMQILGMNDCMNIEEVAVYIEMKINEKLSRIDNFKLYKDLLAILEEEKSKTKAQKNKSTTSKRTIVVD